MARTQTAASPAAAATEPAAEGRSLAQWIEARQRPLLILLGVIVALALGAWFFKVSADRKAAFASQQLSQARAVAEQGDLPRASSELQRIIDTYGGTSAAQEAVISLNQIRMIAGQTGLAVAGLQEFLASGPDPRYVAPAAGLLGAALENAGQPAQAAAAYRQASEAAELPVLQADLLLKAARAHLAAGERERAIEAYQTVVSEYKETPLLTEAQIRLAEITAPVL